MKKLNWKEHLFTRLKITGIIFALVGWFMLVTVTLEKVFNKNLAAMEDFVSTSIFKWGIKISVIILFIILIKGIQEINNLINKYKMLKNILKVYFIGGLIGWIIGLGSLVIQKILTN